MANYTLSYDFVNQVRDMSDIFQTIIEKNPVTSKLLTIDNAPFRNTKLEWLNDYTSPKTWSVTTAHTSGDGEILTTNTTGIESGMIVRFEKTTGARSTLVAKVGTVTANTKFTITVYGGSTDENLAIGTVVELLDKPAQEGSDAGTGTGTEPVADYNYSQIFDEMVQISLTALNQDMYGVNRNPGDVLNYEIEKKMAQLAYKMGATSIGMPRVQRTSGENGTMGGRLWFLQQQGGINATNASSAVISSALLNKAFEKLYSFSMTGANTIVAHPIHAKNFKAMNKADGTNFVMMQDSTTGGSYIDRFVSDFGDVANIVYSHQMDKDKIAIIDPSQIRLRPFEGDAMRDMDATTPGSRSLRRRITGQYSLEVRNPKVMQYIYGLTA